MPDPQIHPEETEEKKDFRWFAAKRIAIGILITVVVLWISGTIMGYFSTPTGSVQEGPTHAVSGSSESKNLTDSHPAEGPIAVPHTAAPEGGHVTPPPAASREPLKPREASEHPRALSSDHATGLSTKTKSMESRPASSEEHHPQPHARKRFPSTGMALVDALIQPLEYELEERFWGWRPNDILEVTDNVNNFQLGVLEVTRRSTVILAERISRTGSTEAFDKNVENAMNWFMIKSNKYWFPSAEAKYRDGLEELRIYFNKLEKRQATFYTRTDNLIPLLMVYEDLLGSCDENLVKQREKDGTKVSFFMADDYFFYTKGVANAMLTLMEAVAIDFEATIESRRGSEVLHHAIESLKLATKIDPFIVFNSDLSGFFANHRANMAAPISHARFYVGVLIKTLST